METRKRLISRAREVPHRFPAQVARRLLEQLSDEQLSESCELPEDLSGIIVRETQYCPGYRPLFKPLDS
jgi:hypothetical protein